MILKVFYLIITIKLNYCNSEHDNLNNKKLLIVSYDGFRNEYFQRNVTHYLNNLKKSGTYTDYMINVFPTKTFPNHHSIVTGVNTNSHGITSNSLYDKIFGELGYGYKLFHYNESIIPIYILNQLAGPNRYSGCMMWPGADFTYKNESCHFFKKYNKRISFYDRVDEIISWFTDPITPANLVLLYIEDPDYHAHGYGPNSKVLTDVIENLNNLTQYIQNKLDFFKLKDQINVIHLSDHGMEGVYEKNVIDLNDILGINQYSYFGTSPILQIIPHENNTKVLYDLLKKASEKDGKFKVYLNEDIPDDWKFRNDKRTGPITVFSEYGYIFQDLYVTREIYAKEFNITYAKDHEYGIHGYDINTPSMHPFFIALGPDIKKNYKIPPFHNIDLIHLFCKLLKIDPPSYVEGKEDSIIPMLIGNQQGFKINLDRKQIFIAVASCLVTFSIILVITVLSLYLIKQKRLKNEVMAVNYITNDLVIEEAESLIENMET